ADSVPDFAGPLAGVLAGLDWAAERVPGATHVASFAGDAPFLPRDLVARLAVAEEGIRKVDAWTARYDLVTVEFATVPIDPFFNANRPDDLAEAERLVTSTRD